MSSRLPRAWEEWAGRRTLENVVTFYRDVLEYIRENGKITPGAGHDLGKKLRSWGLVDFRYTATRGRCVYLTPLAEKLLEAI